MPCGKCNINISSSKSAVCLNCSSNFHPTCTKLKTFTNFKAVKDSWICELCTEKLNAKAVPRKILGSDLNNYDDNMYNLNSVKHDLKKVFKQIESLSHNMKSIEKSITFCSDSIDDFGTKLESAINKISEMENKVQMY